MQRTLRITILLSCLGLAVTAQPLRDINYNYLYNPDSPVHLTLKPVRTSDGWTILYKLLLKDTTNASNITLEWEARETLNSKEGTMLGATVNEIRESATIRSGYFTLPLSNAPKIVVAKVINSTTKRAWFFHTSLEPNYAVDIFLKNDTVPSVSSFIKPESSPYRVASPGPVIVSYYNDKFPAAAPAFSEAQGKVSKAILPDSSLHITANGEFRFFRNGLYLFQTDTSVARGYAVRAESDYPRYSLIQNLPGPLIYICTKNEYDRLETAKGDKKAFDRTVLTITGNTERAKKLIRSYFRGVEMANQYFSSYKEGWKTDRGMVYIVFGPPDEVYKFFDREVWEYDNSTYKASFDFVKSSSVFDPDNYVLIRDKKYRDVWYQVVDLWRNARF
jgi:GWxTD domain-containing protein